MNMNLFSYIYTPYQFHIPPFSLHCFTDLFECGKYSSGFKFAQFTLGFFEYIFRATFENIRFLSPMVNLVY